MKTIILHLTFSAVVLEMRCSLPQLEEKDFLKPQIPINPKGRREDGAEGPRDAR